jgi:starch synthase (maltosyl-transferring)
VLEIVADRPAAEFAAWYEMFARSQGTVPGRSATFADMERRLDEIRWMGFDVIYLPPIHPIGHTNRKGPNNSLVCPPGSPGCPYAIGDETGGHTAIHPELGTLEDFRRFERACRARGMEIALDFALQTSPDHPWVQEHPEWFSKRPDGSIKYAENPPKKYEDIYPINFATEDREGLWNEMLKVIQFWMNEGVRIFRVDNPHTKPFPFWEWLIGRVKESHPDVLFLSEAFTRPKKMHRLAKLGFTQSYTYFTWRNTKEELSRFFTETFRREGREYFRPNFWPNTPDILNEYLQVGGRAAFMVRLVLAATAAGSYGIYGPAFELCDDEPREPGSEEYLDSEKYQIRVWDLERPGSLRPFIRRLNRIRRENPALQQTFGFQLVEVENDKLLAYLKSTRDGSNLILVVVNLDPHHMHSGWIHLPLGELGLEGEQAYQVHDLITDARYLWYGSRNFVSIDPASVPAHLFRLRRRVRSEEDFEYFV